MTKLTSLLVGAHFRPPAKLIIASLETGCQLGLRPEPDNPYDNFALAVWLNPKQIPEFMYPTLSDQLPSMGFQLEELLNGPDVQLGYVAASGGKPLIGTGLSAGNQEFLAVISGPACGELGFLPDGKPTVTLIQ